ncbi:helix-turn-helix transcriptional regulator [Paenibacillus sp. FSL H8-0034]|uniref:helix-turn-helix transcriptional regulator n=1 Tax=Paenibacillus sp. FSL H8-0034 TaxID=2954671 RepID=UPI0030F83510
MKNIVKYLRRSQEFDITQQQLGAIVGVSKATISAIENGAKTSAEVMLKIARYFNKDPREIFFVADVNCQITDPESARDDNGST